MVTLAADLGGTRIKLGVVIDGVIAAVDSLPSRADEGLSPGLPKIADGWSRQLSSLGLATDDCDTVALGFPGLVTRDGRRVLRTYGKWDDAIAVDLQGWAKQQFDAPLILENDTRLALLGERRGGAGAGCDNLVLVTLGTGVGTSAIVEGRLLRGVHGQAGILGGHFTTNRQGPRCACGGVGCAEAEASTSVLPRLVREQHDFPHSALSQAPAVDYEMIFSLARQGDACAIRIKEHSIAVWAQVIVNLVHAYDPERVIVGGGIIAGAEDFLEELKAAVRASVHSPWGEVEVVASALGSSAALLGLDALARELEAS